MELVELNQQNEVIEYLKKHKCQVTEILQSGAIKKSYDLLLTINRLSDNNILFFKIPSIGYHSIDTVFLTDTINDIHKLILKQIHKIAGV